MASIPLYTWNHVDSILRTNFELSQYVRRFGYVKNGFAAIDALHGTQINPTVDTAQSRLADRIRPLYPESTFGEKVQLTHEALLVVAAPFSMYALSKIAFKQLKIAFEETLPLFIRVYNLFKAAYFGGIVCVIASVTLKKITPIVIRANQNPTVQRVLEVSSKFFMTLYKVGSIAEIVALAMEFKQAQDNLVHSDSEAPFHAGIYKDCFGINAEKMRELSVAREDLDSQIRLYRYMKMVQLANTTANFAASYVFPALPAAPIVIMGTVFVKVGLEFWWHYKVSQFKDRIGFIDKPESKVSKFARLVSLAASPFLFAKQTSAIAGITIAAALSADIYSQSVIAAA